jgi:hypothetical protein
MEKYFRINYLGIEVSDKIIKRSNSEYYKLTYTQALELDLIEGDKDGWRLPTIKEWKFLSAFGPLGIISLSQLYYLTSDAYEGYIPEKIRDEDDEIQQTLDEDPFAFDNSGMDQIYVWDVRENEEWEQYDGDVFSYILIRDF